MRALRRVVVGLLVLAVVVGLGLTGMVVLYAWNRQPLPLSDQCVAHVAELSVPLTTEQAHNASIVAGVATRRGLVPRAATIGLATVYQESGLRNLDHGDRDSLGLFQQRPSQGWGTVAQVQDPWYASNAFYEVLVTIDGWRVGNVNDVAQAVQRSGHPQGYAKHVENARRLASSLTGETPASFSCLVKNPPPGDAAGLAEFLRKTLPTSSRVEAGPGTVTIAAESNQLAWSAAHIAVANTARYGVARVEVGSRHWTPSGTSTAPWLGETDNSTRVVVHLGVAPTPTPSR